MSRAPKLYLVCYDISDPRRLRLVYKTMRGYGDHLQYSVFRCVLSDLQMANLEDSLSRTINHDEDQVLLIHLGSAESKRSWRSRTLGRPLVHPERVVRII